MQHRNQRQVPVYLPTEVIEEIQAEAVRLDRSVAWMLRRAWELAREEIKAMPRETPDV